MTKLNLLLQYTDYHEQYKSYGRKLYHAIEGKLGWEAKPNESKGQNKIHYNKMYDVFLRIYNLSVFCFDAGHLDTMLRSLVLMRMTTFGHEKTIEEAKKRFKGHLSGEKHIIADLRSVVYRGVLATGDEQTLDTVLKVIKRLK